MSKWIYSIGYFDADYIDELDSTLLGFDEFLQIEDTLQLCFIDVFHGKKLETYGFEEKNSTKQTKEVLAQSISGAFCFIFENEIENFNDDDSFVAYSILQSPSAKIPLKEIYKKIKNGELKLEDLNLNDYYFVGCVVTKTELMNKSFRALSIKQIETDANWNIGDYVFHNESRTHGMIMSKTEISQNSNTTFKIKQNGVIKNLGKVNLIYK